MARVAREVVERAGVNVDQLVELLVKNAAAELTTFYYYTILRVNLVGLDGEGIKEISETARIEDRNHFEALVPRIYELGGKLNEGRGKLKELTRYIYYLTSLNMRKLVKQLAERLRYTDHIYVIGRGLQYPTALETALKIKEVSIIAYKLKFQSSFYAFFIPPISISHAPRSI